MVDLDFWYSSDVYAHWLAITTLLISCHDKYEKNGICLTEFNQKCEKDAIFCNRWMFAELAQKMCGNSFSPLDCSFIEKREASVPDKLEKVCSETKETLQNILHEVGCAVNSVMREFTDYATDLSVKVPGGSIALHREYKAGKWQWDHLIQMKEGRPDGAAQTDYVSKGEVPYKKIRPGVFQNQTFTMSLSQ